ncbi:unnamed protein product [Ambrosiozyma monospora]|uniref:Unnamed protein product n=1 Tax=Ambrosiozyma monospora TaxID=43982 RepID=A0ACB5TCL7_AMBMO|nr:unnamed protein product [Ambrosiozyma monospora]
MRASLAAFAKYTPLIKFVGGPHPIPKHIPGPPQPHPCAPGSLLPSKAGASSPSGSSAAAVPFESRNVLSKRFRYAPLEEAEIENVISGGAEVVF